ncbi:MAG: hypothetical protein MN733_38840, partial [Nitrososphaera sp.]|nr:hypothetical protein [Nitrososphaera sp.]
PVTRSRNSRGRTGSSARIRAALCNMNATLATAAETAGVYFLYVLPLLVQTFWLIDKQTPVEIYQSVKTRIAE